MGVQPPQPDLCRGPRDEKGVKGASEMDNWPDQTIAPVSVHPRRGRQHYGAEDW